jgi:hypothetical protein
MARTMRIWQRKLHPERLPFGYFKMYDMLKQLSNDCFEISIELEQFLSDFKKIKIYVQDKPSVIRKRWRIRNRWWRTLRHRNNSLCKKTGMRWQYEYPMYDYTSEEIIDEIDEYFGTRYRTADYVEWFD